MDLPSRDLKATKIARLIGASSAQPARRMLEVGTGSGGIAHYFGTAGPMGWDVESLDVEDVRIVTEGYRFRCTQGIGLPFADASFDVVVSNHVIEHVGEAAEQSGHLAEIARVLRPGGVGYLAVPCRWMLVEPHFRLPFLSWLPQALADAYVRAARKGACYDCRPLTVGRLEREFAAAGLACRQHHGDALRMTYEIERPDAFVRRVMASTTPDAVYAGLRRIFPTLIYTFGHATREARPRAVPTR